MADNYLITGYWGEPHVTAENDRGINAAIFGAGRFVLPVGEQFRAEFIGNNTIRMYDGKLLDNGAAAGIPAGKYVDLLVPEAGQGMKRNDLIIFEYSKDASTSIETGSFKVLSGTESSENAVDPELTQDDLLFEETSFDQMALWRVSVSGSVISAPVRVFEVSKNIKNAAPDSKTVSLPVSGWVGGKQTVSVDGVTADEMQPIFVSPTPESFKVYGENGVYCSAQAEGKLTFTCESVPATTLKVNLTIFG